MTVDPLAQMEQFKQWARVLIVPTEKDEVKYQHLQSIADNLEVITASPQYASFLEEAVPIFLKVLRDGPAQHLAELSGQQLRKTLLEVLHRLPTNDHLRPFVKDILNLMFHLLDVDNEENVLICLRTVIELHKHYRPPFSPEIQQFLQSVKRIYADLPNNMPKIFEPRKTYRVKDLSEVNVSQNLLSEVFSVTVIQSEKKNADGSAIQINVIPKATCSLKVLAELPIIVVLMYQLYRENVRQDVADFIPLIMITITLQPREDQMKSANFNREVFVDFMAAQVKTLSFLAYIIRVFQELISQKADLLTTGTLTLLRNCPQEVASLRKELLIAARHILATDLRNQFVGCIDQLFDESVLIGSGWTTYESLRPLAYSTVADLVHHVRAQLPMKDLAAAVSLFSRNVHDETLPTSIQTMSCKLLMNLVDGIRLKGEEAGGTQSRELLMRMLEVFVLKFQSVAELHIPALIAKTTAAAGNNSGNNSNSNSNSITYPGHSGQQQPPAAPSTPTPGQSSQDCQLRNEDNKSVLPDASSAGKEEKPKFGFPPSPSANYNLNESRALVKTLVGGIKTVVNGIPSPKVPGQAVDPAQAQNQNKLFLPKETIVFVRLVKYAMKALDVYMISAIPAASGGNNASSGISSGPGTLGPGGTGVAAGRQQLQSVRSKEEKEVLEHFAGVFQTLSPQIFREIFSTMINYVVERIHSNYSLQIVANSFLAHPSTSPIFATILVEYLLERMEDIGTNSRTNAEKSNLYLKLFKLVFGSVSLFALENEQMLKPHLHAIVNRSMELALSAKEPYNYFLLLRALFRSIGGGSHDLLYQEFLPLLPSLLQGLNSLQSGLHKQHMKDLFVELCLTVPVRLSSLLPYLPMLMDPLVSALNGSQTLVSQGLRTLELCVDNLQPDFLYDHIQPVRAELMQALWRTLRKPADNVAMGSFRVLGKFGGGNRKMMTEPQKFRYNEVREGFVSGGSTIIVPFLEHKEAIHLSIDMAVEVAFNSLKSSSTDPFYRRQCWEVIKGYLIAHMQHSDEDDKLSMKRFFNHPSFSSNEIAPLSGPFYKCQDTEIRKIHEMALTGMFVAAAIKELRSHVLSFMVHLVRHYTLVAISQQTGPINLGGRQHKLHSMDPLVLIDAIVAVMGHEEKELCKPGHVALIVILDTASTVLGTKERACQLPLTEYLVERMCSLCYERAWYAKLGGCFAIKFLFERMTLKWVFAHHYTFVKALFFVMMDLTGEVSSGAVDMAKINLEKMLILCSTPLDAGAADLIEAQKKSLFEVTQELVRQLSSPNTCVRQQSVHSLEVLAKTQGKAVTEIIEPHRDVLADVIPPKKHILKHQPVNTQIGIMDGNTFCFTLEPRLFTIDISIHEHDLFFEDLFKLCDSDDTVLLKLPCYKNVTNLVPLRKSALRCLSACHYIHQRKDKIFNVLFKAVNASNAEIQETGFECMSVFVKHVSVEQEVVTNAVSPLFRCIIADHRALNHNVVLRLTYLSQLFPYIFQDQTNDKILAHLKSWLETMIRANRANRRFNDEMKICSSIIIMYSKIQSAPSRYAELLLGLVFKAEKAMLMEPGSTLRTPLRKFLQRYPEHTLELLLTERNLNEDQIYRFFKFLLKGEDGEIFRKILMKNPMKLVKFASGPIAVNEKVNPQQMQQQQQQQQMQQQQQQQQQQQMAAATPPPAGTPPVDAAGSPAVQAMPSPQKLPPPQSPAVPSPAQMSPSPTQANVVVVNYDLQYQAILITSILIKHDETWLSTQPALVQALKNLWFSESFHEKHAKVESVDYVQWEEPKLLLKCLLNHFSRNPDDIELLFRLLRAFTVRFICDFEFFRVFLEQTVSRYPVEWKRSAFMRFVEIFKDDSYTQNLKAKILQFILIPCFALSFELGEGEKLIGGPPAPDQDPPDNLISVFILQVIDPDHPFSVSDAVRILLLQFSCLLVEQASPHIHDAANKRQGNKLRRLMTFAWPCLLPNTCVDPATKYHGHLLLAHIIGKFAIHKRIVLQVFHSLLKAYAVEARNVVRQALEILTPAMPQRMEDGNTMLTHWTKKIIIEEGHTLGQLVHMLQLLIKHYKVYYPVRHHLIQHMVTSIQRLGFTPNASIEHKKIAVDLAEVIIRWEAQRAREEQEALLTTVSEYASQSPSSQSMASSSSAGVVKQEKTTSDSGKPVEKAQADGLVNFLLRLACHVNEGGPNAGSPGELLSKRCVQLLKSALKPEIWPNSDMRLAWFDKLLMTVEQQQPNYGNIVTGLDLLGYLLPILRKDQILSSFKPLQKGIAACMTCTNSKVIRAVHTLLSKLMQTFPTEPATSNSSSKYEELEFLYSSVNKIILDGLSNFEKSANPLPQNLFSTLMVLKAACVNNGQYIDRMLVPFMRVLLRMAKDHLSQPIESNSMMSSELLILSLDLVKNRIGQLTNDMRKLFFQTILINLIEKSPDVKVLKAITKMVEDWVKAKPPYPSGNQMPGPKEKSILLVRMMQFYEKRFPNEPELIAQYLELVNYIYRDESLKNGDLTQKLEGAFMAGLRCNQPSIRAKFFEVFDASIRKRLIDRLLYIVCSQNWEHIGQHFWIKQCIEFLIVTAVPNQPLESGTPSAMLPSPTSVIALGDQNEKAALSAHADQMDTDVASVSSFDASGREPEEDLDIEISSNEEGHCRPSIACDLHAMYLAGIGGRRPSTPSDPKQTLQVLLKKENAFIQSLRDTQTIRYLLALAQLCHMETDADLAPDSSLAYQVWVQLFPKVWKILSDKQQNALSQELVPFICSGAHVPQKDMSSSSIGCFVEALSHCNPVIPIRPSVIKYLGKSHNLWHRATLMIENTVFEKTHLAVSAASTPKLATRSSSTEDPDVLRPSIAPGLGTAGTFQPLAQEALDALSELYETLKEEDLWVGLWQKRARYPETQTAIALEQQGLFEQAQVAYETAMTKAKGEYSTGPSPVSMRGEYILWENHWVRCSKELNQWDLLVEFGQHKSSPNPFLVMESAWRIPQWDSFKVALNQVEHNCPKESMWKIAMFKGYLCISEPSENNINVLVDRWSEAANTFCIKEWRRLPPLVSHIHIRLLQAAQQIMELQEAGQIHAGFLPSASGRSQSLHDMKAIVKTWRNRLPVLADDLSHWSDIFAWRQHHYQAIVTHYEGQSGATAVSVLPTVAGAAVAPTAAAATAAANLQLLQPQASTDSTAASVMLGVHASAQSIIYYGKIARKHGLTNVCLEALNRIHSIPSVPVVDCFQKIRQQVKCYLQISGSAGKNEYQEGLEVIESTNLKFFTKEMTAEFYALKGLFLAQSGRSDEANKAFSAAAQLHDNLNKAWSLWGDYLETMFTKDRWAERQMHLGTSALTCYLQACRHQNESKSRKYLAKVLWLLTYDDEDNTLEKAVKNYNAGIPPVNWLPWIPQLLTWLVRSDGKLILEILTQVGRVFPQAVYFPVRTLYLTLKLEHRTNTVAATAPASQSADQAAGVSTASSTSSESSQSSQQTSSASASPAPHSAALPSQSPGSQSAVQPVPPPMWRCSKIMHTQRELHPTILSSLEAFVDQMVWFKENWYEEVLRQLRQVLAKCYAVAYENRNSVAEATVTPNTLNFVKKVVATFGVGIENVSSVSTNYATAVSESLARRAQATAQDPVFQKMKLQFTADFDFSNSNSMKLHNLISKLKKWIKLLDAKIAVLPKSQLIEEKCRFLSTFSQQTAEVELPGEFLLPRHTGNHYYVRIARFMPRIEIVQKHNTAARRIMIRGHNGKIYPYLLVNDTCLSDARREERVLQLFRLLNHYLSRQKETAKRFLSFTVARVVAISPQTRLVQDNPCSISLMDIYKERCSRKSVDPDAPIAKYYDKLAVVQARGSQVSQQVLRDILKEIQKDVVPSTLLKEWAEQTFTSATDLWTFRKQFTLQLSLIAFAEYTLHLTRLNPDMLYIHQDSGLLNVSYFRFDSDLDASRPVSFRLTHNFSEFITSIGVTGPMTASMIATARCFTHPNFKVQSILKTILRDEVMTWNRRGTGTGEVGDQPEKSAHMSGEALVQMVNKCTTGIMSRMQTLANFNGADSEAGKLVTAANSHDNLCRMDPAWHPWL